MTKIGPQVSQLPVIRLIINVVIIFSGVKFIRNGNYHTVKSLQEIIISAGTINSPQLLMLSGIGPQEHLEQIGINPLIDLPVGDNLHDHVTTFGLHFLINENQTEDQSTSDQTGESPSLPGLIRTNEFLNLKNLFDWFSSGSGPLAEFPQTITLIETKFRQQNSDGNSNFKQKVWPDVYLETFLDILPDDYDSFHRLTQLSKSVWQTTYSSFAGQLYFTILPKLLRPRSRGLLRLQSSNPFTAPSIDPQYLSNPYDITVLLEGIKIALQIALSLEFNRNSQIFITPIPGCIPCAPFIQTAASFIYFKTLKSDNKKQQFNFNHQTLSACDEYLACISRVLTRAGNNLVS